MVAFLKWFSIIWSIAAIAIVVVSNWMYRNEIEIIAGLGSFNVKDHIAVALLLAPGGISSIAHYYFVKKTQ